MEYRLIKEKNTVKVYNEESSELICTMTLKRHLLLRKKIVFDKCSNDSVTRGILQTRKWKMGNSKITFKWFMLGKGIKIKHDSLEFEAKEFYRGHLIFKEKESGRTGLIIDISRLTDKNSVLIEHYERFPLEVSLAATLLSLKRLKYW